MPPSIEDLVEIGQAILDSFPPPIRDLVASIPIRVQDWPEDSLLEELGFDDALELTGLFRGAGLPGRDSSVLPPEEPEMIFLFRMPILHEWCEASVPLEQVVFDVLTHEIAHFFGLSEESALRLEGRLPD